MRRLFWMFALLFLVACGSAIQSGTGNTSVGNAQAGTVTPTTATGSASPPPTNTPVPPTTTPVTPTAIPSVSPSPTAVQCAWQWAQRYQPEVQAKLETALRDAGVPGATATVEDLGETCAGQFHKMYTRYVMVVTVADLTDAARLDALTAKATGVVRSFSQSRSDRISIVFASGGKREIRDIQKG
jgi:hypothetical protein